MKICSAAFELFHITDGQTGGVILMSAIPGMRTRLKYKQFLWKMTKLNHFTFGITKTFH
jgi:hypothetical protein